MREIRITETSEIPWLSVLLGYAPMLPFVAGAAGSWFLTGAPRQAAVLLTAVWGGAILSFLAGVRRGLSFRTEGGPAPLPIATMFALFCLALAALVSAVLAAMTLATGCLLVGFILILVLDPIAAREGQAPLFFARLRPPQMLLAVASLAALMASLFVR